LIDPLKKMESGRGTKRTIILKKAVTVNIFAD
jgi:hypothetical protein